MSRRIAHRGPDDHGFLRFDGDGVAREREWSADAPSPATVLIHRRLSILDLAASGWQPMATPDGRYHIVFNGEIYNFVELRTELESLGEAFTSRSDTEVLLRALARWGEAALPRLVGMFAFALLDTHDRTLLLARDPFGIKPLYHATTGTAFGFASEIKALLELPGLGRAPDAERLYEYLVFGSSSHGARTLFAGVSQLPAAHVMRVPLDDPGAAVARRYWTVPLDRRSGLSFEQAAEELRERFLESVRLHLRSDVPVGAALSGGVDSSAIVAAMRRVEPGLELHTFSYAAESDALNEERWARIAGEAAGARMHWVRPEAAELVADLDSLILAQDEPFGGTSMYAQHRVFRLAAESGVTVMLDGQGADELLAGYPLYSAARLASLVRQGRPLDAVAFMRALRGQPGRGGTLARAAQFLLPEAVQPAFRRAVGRELVPAWLRRDWFRDRGVTARAPARLHRSRDVLRHELGNTLNTLSLPMLLRYEDRNSMAFSIESRVPFLTAGLAEFVFSLPEEYLIDRQGTTKSVFRRAMRGLVPDALLDRRDKIGFATPEQEWLSVLRPWVEGVLASPAARRIPALDPAAVSHEWRRVLAGETRFDARVWRWLNLIRWAELYEVDFGA
jgi:asparagine synthase (glutamine-hydrolysing)